MSNDESVVLPVDCCNEDCGMVSSYRFWRDGSYRKVLDACWHTKRMPSKATIEKEIEKEKANASSTESAV